MGTAIQMVGSSSGGSQNGLASIDVPQNGRLIGLDWSSTVSYDTDGDYLLWQLSFGSTLSIVNDSRQVISNFSQGQFESSTAVGVVGMGGSYFVVLPDISVSMGERLYLHSIGAAGVVGACYVLLHFDFDLDKVQVRRR